MSEALLPGAQPAQCSCCHRPVPTGRLHGPGYGEKCARKRGLLPPRQPRLPRREAQDGPDLFHAAGHTSHVTDQAELAEHDETGGPMIPQHDDLADDPTPRIVIDHRYPPRLCAAPDCTLPPHVRWRVAVGGMLYGQYRRIGDALDLCDIHEREVADLCEADWDDQPRPARLPEQREKGAA